MAVAAAPLVFVVGGRAAGVGLVALLIAVCVYFLPSLIAGLRGHHQFGPILVINVLLGWTFIGWVVALAMSLSRIPEEGQG
ncbi:MAG TPA: superinfection immunity protein [Dehalococcoidia bacterium]|nr:superinfection immunity protein [Dehalococcoidia bacterium]